MVQNYLVHELLKLKNEYLDKIHSYNHIREFLPDADNQGLFDKSHLQKLHTFFKLNKIYYKEESLVLGNIPCISYEG
ncbi:MAG TPA: hypothetical protein VFX75_04500, partial [Nitrososphaeraceae archaeon]|nr:hypothetical protein [Nitrososphaeraceae archaeon]